MSYGGLRGAVAFALALIIDESVIPTKKMMVTTVISVVYFTVFVQVCIILKLNFDICMFDLPLNFLIFILQCFLQIKHISNVSLFVLCNCLQNIVITNFIIFDVLITSSNFRILRNVSVNFRLKQVYYLQCYDIFRYGISSRVWY